jgi:hypothetical protein
MCRGEGAEGKAVEEARTEKAKLRDVGNHGKVRVRF